MSGAAQEEAAAAQMDALVARVSAAVAATLRAELAELRSLSQEVPKLVARTEELEQFVEGLKPDGKDPVVRRDAWNFALGVMGTTQTLAEELKARVDELAALNKSSGGFCGGASAGRPPVAVDPGTLLRARAARTGGRTTASR